MSLPGEVNQEIGKAYVSVLNGCLEHTVRSFEKSFDIYHNPEKLTFKKYNQIDTFSFDSSGVIRKFSGLKEVFIESKGYTNGSSLLSEYRKFVAKAYVTTVLNYRHFKDLFWFVTNVPFGSNVGREITSKRYLIENIFRQENQFSDVKEVIGDMPIDNEHVASLSERLSVCLFTDSFIKISGLVYKVEKDESIWTIMEKLHANKPPEVDFNLVAHTVKQLNPKVKDPNEIIEGERLHLPWYGIDRDLS